MFSYTIAGAARARLEHRAGPFESLAVEQTRGRLGEQGHIDIALELDVGDVDIDDGAVVLASQEGEVEDADDPALDQIAQERQRRTVPLHTGGKIDDGIVVRTELVDIDITHPTPLDA